MPNGGLRCRLFEVLGPGILDFVTELCPPQDTASMLTSDQGKGVTRPCGGPVAQNGTLGPENPKSATSRSATWRCLKVLAAMVMLVPTVVGPAPLQTCVGNVRSIKNI